MKFKFDQEKAIAVVLYVANKILEKEKPAGLHKIFKIVYFADQKHLARWGRPVSTDFFVAMKHGPVPSVIYDILKSVQGDSFFVNQDKFSEYFEVKGHTVIPKQKPDMDFLSETDITYLDESIEENAHLGFGALQDKSHDQAWEKTFKNDRIPFKCIAQEGGASSEMLSYIRHNAEIDTIATV
ncbi:MAG: Panacea domain-containing protein [Pseudomonadota bacterium]|nr:Panacea domain-containing protein [Pseudomonadota bacterium]